MAPAFAYLRSHYEELRRRHPDQFVVVKDSTVLAANRSVDAVLQFLRREKIDERTVLIEFIPSEASSLVVWGGGRLPTMAVPFQGAYKRDSPLAPWPD